MKTKYSITLLLCIILGFLMVPQTIAQEEEQTQEEVVEIIYPFLELKYLKNNDDQKVLNARLFNSTDIGEQALSGQPIKFYSNMEDPELLGEVETNRQGIASFVISSDQNLLTDEAGNWWFSSEFEGNETMEMTSAEVTVMDVTLEMEVTDAEGIKEVKLTAYTMADGEMVPVAGEDVYLFVPRMFRMLPVADGYLEDDGTIVFEFPEGIPGDAEGNLTVIGRFNDHWQFGNVEKIAKTMWGVPTTNDVVATQRALWTQVAPWWMVITLTILLLGVWGHYTFALISIFRIWKEGKKIRGNTN